MAQQISELLTHQRQEQEWSQRQLAEEVGIHRSLVSKIECGKEVPSAQLARSIAEVLDGDPVRFELAAGHIPDEFREALLKHEELRDLLTLAAGKKLTDEDWNNVRDVVERHGTEMVNVPVWLE